MAVIQISRIQVRRGKAKEFPVPQLASGEIGWAIDTQELYIGNGAVSEGAPQVGNTKILTEADDLLELAGQYAYKRDEIQTGASVGEPVLRPLQDKLDDTVSLFDFLPVETKLNSIKAGNTVDVTDDLQRAVDQLFLNSNKGSFVSRIKLRIPAGNYLLTGPVFIPPFANIEGDGVGKTYFNVTGAHAFYTKNGDSVIGSYADDSTTTSDNMPRQITLKGMSINHQSYGGALRLESCKDSVFEDIEFTGQWANGDGIDTSVGDSGDAYDNTTIKYIGILMNSLSTAVSTNNNVFINCTFNGLVHAVYSDFDASYNKFEKGRIENCGNGFSFGSESIPGAIGQVTGPSYNIISGYDFIDVDRFGVNIELGTGNKTTNNVFKNVGNEAGGSATPVWPVMNFANRGNISDNDYFERTADLTVDRNFHTSILYPPEIAGKKNYRNNFPVSGRLDQNSGYFMQLPADQPAGKIEIDYTYDCPISTGPVYQTGKITVTWNKENSEFLFTDEYTFTGNPTKEGQLTWTANLVNNAGQFEDKITFDYVNNILDENNVVDEFTFYVTHYA